MVPEALLARDRLPEVMWLEILGHLESAADLCAVEACSTDLCELVRTSAALWAELHRFMFGFDASEGAGRSEESGGGEGNAESMGASEGEGEGASEGEGEGEGVGVGVGVGAPSHAARDPRSACCASDAAMGWWLAHARGGGTACTAPTELPLPAMRAMGVAAGVGVSAHAGKLVRVWEADTGRRLGAAALRQQPSCCAVGGDEVGGVAAVGDVCGGVQLLWLEHGSDPVGTHAAFGRGTAVHSCALLGLQLEHWAAESVRGVLACGSGGGEVLSPSPSLILSLNPHTSVSTGPDP